MLMNLGVNIGLAISGFFGSLMFVGKHSQKSFKEQLFAVIGGTMSANYLTPVVIDLFQMEKASTQYGVAFVIGFGGLKAVEYFYEKWFTKNG